MKEINRENLNEKRRKENRIEYKMRKAERLRREDVINGGKWRKDKSQKKAKRNDYIQNNELFSKTKNK